MSSFEFKTSFDANAMSDLLKHSSFTKHLSTALDFELLVSAQKKNLDAVEANKAAAAGYQDLFKKQIAIFEETMAAAQQQLRNSGGAKVEREMTKDKGRTRQGGVREGAYKYAGLGRERTEGECGDPRRARVKEEAPLALGDLRAE